MGVIGSQAIGKMNANGFSLPRLCAKNLMVIPIPFFITGTKVFALSDVATVGSRNRPLTRPKRFPRSCVEQTDHRMIRFSVNLALAKPKPPLRSMLLVLKKHQNESNVKRIYLKCQWISRSTSHKRKWSAGNRQSMGFRHPSYSANRWKYAGKNSMESIQPLLKANNQAHNAHFAHTRSRTNT